MAFYRDTWVEVDLDAISENVGNMRQLLPEHTQIIAVVKANAYGHGAEYVAKTALASGASALAVAFLDEALALRKKRDYRSDTCFGGSPSGRCRSRG